MKRGKRVDPWFPFFIDKWLFGSTRHELIINEDWKRIWPQLVPMVPPQILEAPFTDLRGIYADLMTLSKKDGGFIRANEKVPYPHSQLAGQFCVPLEHLELTIKICLHKDVKKLVETSPGIYFIPTTEVYALSERYIREINAQLAENKSVVGECSASPEQTAGKTEPIGEERRGEDISLSRESVADTIEKIDSLWNEFAEKYGLTKIEGIKKGTTRWSHINARVREKGFDFPKILEIVEKSPFLLGRKEGRKGSAFFVTFDWLICPSNFQKVKEGAYLERGRPAGPAPGNWLKKFKEKEGTP